MPKTARPSARIGNIVISIPAFLVGSPLKANPLCIAGRVAVAATLEAMRHTNLIKDQSQAEVHACIDLRFLDATEH